MNKTAHWVILSIVAVIATAFILMPRNPIQQTPATLSSPSPPAVPVDNEPLTRFPVSSPAAEGPADDVPLPALNDSDPALLASLGTLSDPARLGRLFIFKNLIRRVVVTVDNLPRSRLPLRDLPVPTLSGEFEAKPQGVGKAELDPDNYHRYQPYVRLIESLDAQKLAEVYVRFYPLFQEAYGDLGYSNAYFNDRLVTVIDDLLATPRVEGRIALVQPAVVYKYADPKLEALSAGQKLMIRIGPDNAERVKAKLRELRRALTHRKGGTALDKASLKAPRDER